MQEESRSLNKIKSKMYKLCLDEIKPIFDDINDLKARVFDLEKSRENKGQGLQALLADYNIDYNFAMENEAYDVNIQDYKLETRNLSVNYPRVYGLSDPIQRKK